MITITGECNGRMENNKRKMRGSMGSFGTEVLENKRVIDGYQNEN